MPPHLKPLLAIVIVMAISHTILKVRARAAAGRGRRRAATGARASGPPAVHRPEEALAALRRAVEERP
jgi:hypothetical protein